MKLDYELVRVKNCAELQQKGFMIRPNTRVYKMCSDVIPISAWIKAKTKVLDCKIPSKPWWKPWYKPKPNCNNNKDMSTLSLQRGEKPSERVKGISKSTLVLQREAAKVAEKKPAKKSTKTKSE